MNRFIICALLLLPLSLSAQDDRSVHELRLRADKSWYQNANNAAELDYRRALIKEPDEAAIKYNLANALMKQQKFSEAKPYLEEAVQTDDSEIASKSWYNLGNLLFDEKAYEKAIEAYKAALRLNSNDLEAKKNLTLAKKLLEEKKKQSQKENPDNGNPDQTPQQPSSSNNQDAGNNEQPDEAPANAASISKEEARRALQMMNEHDKEARKRMHRRKDETEGQSIDNDW